MLIRIAVSLVSIALFMPIASSARADMPDERAQALVTALQAAKFDEAEAHFSPQMKAGLPPDKLKEVWQRLEGQLGKLKSFAIADRKSAGDQALRIIVLDFENGTGVLNAQVAISPSGEVAGLFFRPARNNPDAPRLADQRATEVAAALQAGKFDEAEVHFSETMKTDLSPARLSAVWHQQADSFGALKTFNIAQRSGSGAVEVRVINLSFEKGLDKLALKIAIDPSGQISGLFFMPAVTPTP